MLDTPANDARVTARIPSAAKETLQEAADLSGATLNQFLVQSALAEARRILAAERVITLSEADAQKVFSLIENPPPPNERLRGAIEKHQAFFRASH